jgi:hypothetical protein
LFKFVVSVNNSFINLGRCQIQIGHFGFTPDNGHQADRLARLLCAMSRNGAMIERAANFLKACRQNSNGAGF